MVEKLPIIYVRGFAGDTAGIDTAVDDPFYGFNAGSTHVRVGGHGDPIYYQFESPLIRLHLDHGYEFPTAGERGQEAYLEGAEKPGWNTIWIHRFYDEAASTFGKDPKPFSLEHAAEDLLGLIEQVRNRTGAPRVFLVAHSMGGLICRGLIQKVLPERGKRAVDYVDKLFTYGTPHKGIHFHMGWGLPERLRDLFNIGGADIFGPQRMYEYLTPNVPEGAHPPQEWNPAIIPADVFPLDRVFCLIGTNPENYEVAHGLSAAAVGPESDGLVQTDSAYVPGARFAYVHRSHSGRYGLVNSEEGYQNLRRFLLGDLDVDCDFINAGRLVHPPDGQEWQADIRLSVRGVSVVMHEQVADHWCPVLFRPDGAAAPDGALKLVTTSLMSGNEHRPTETMRYALHLRLLNVPERDGHFDWKNHLERVGDFDDILVVDIAEGADTGIWYAWASAIPGRLENHHPAQGKRLEFKRAGDSRWLGNVDLPDSATGITGKDAKIRLTVTQRN